MRVLFLNPFISVAFNEINKIVVKSINNIEVQKIVLSFVALLEDLCKVLTDDDKDNTKQVTDLLISKGIIQPRVPQEDNFLKENL